MNFLSDMSFWQIALIVWLSGQVPVGMIVGRALRRNASSYPLVNKEI